MRYVCKDCSIFIVLLCWISHPTLIGHCRLTLCGMPEDVEAAQEEAKNIMRQYSWPHTFHFTN